MEKRKIIYSFEDEEELVKFVDFLLQEIPSCNISIKIKGGKKVELIVYGTKWEVRNICSEIKKLRKEFIMLTKSIKGPTSIPLRRLYKSSGKAVPTECVILALEKIGYRAIVEGGVLRTDAPIDVVLSVSKSIVKAMDELRLSAENISTKKFISVIHAITELSLEEIVSLSLREGIVVSSDVGKYRLSCEWHDAVEKMLRKIGFAPNS